MHWPPMATRATPVADLWSGLWAAILAACGLFALVDAFAPAQDLPWKPLDLRQPIGAATAAKLAALEVSDADTAQRADQLTAQCLTLLRQAGVTASRVPDQDDGGFCVVRGAVRISGGEQTPLNPAGVVMRCPMAARLLLWDRETVQPASRDILGSQAARIDNLGTFACRRVYGSRDAAARPSQHARANALDVSGVRLSDGRRVSVAEDWDGLGPTGREGAIFLRRLRDGGCKLFKNVLTPDYNAAHGDHFHLDAAATGVCARTRD